MQVTQNIYNIGANNEEIRLFEGQYIVPNGMSYNSYLIKDEKNVILDTVDKCVTEKWLQNLENTLNGENIDYLIISHMEPDHSYNIGRLLEKFPEMKIVGNALTFNMLSRFFDVDIENRKILVKEGDTLNTGKHTLKFVMAPMVHWPEVMFTYEQTEKLLFSADAFGKFGTIKENEDWLEEARRYYVGIVGKFGPQVQAVLKKLENFEIQQILPLHGPVLKENLAYYIEKYDKWSSYKPEEEGILIACSSIHGNTLEAAKYLQNLIKENNKNVELVDLTKVNLSQAISLAFKYSKLIVASSSYNAGLFPPMEQFLNNLKERNFSKRKVAIIENGTWAPSSGKVMKEILSQMKEIELVEKVITIKSTMNDETKQELKELAENM